MRRCLPGLLLALLAGCASSGPGRTTGPSSASAASTTSVAVPFADGPKVREAFPPAVQELLLEGELEVVLFESGRAPLPDERAVNGLPVVQAAVLTDRTERARLLAKLYEGVERAEGIAGCYEPHHLLVARRGASTVEVEICFRCLQLEVDLDGQDGGRWPTSKAAEPLLESLVGPVRERSFHGRTLHGWRETLARAAEARARGEDAAVDPDGVRLLARSLGWRFFGGWSAEVASLEVLHALGAAAVPAVPGLVEALRNESLPVRIREAILGVLGQIGPAAEGALPAIEPLERHLELGPAARAARAGISGR